MNIKYINPPTLALGSAFAFAFTLASAGFAVAWRSFYIEEAPCVCHPCQADHMPWPLPLSICSYLWAPRTHNASRPPNSKLLECSKRLGANFKNKDCVCVFFHI